MNFEIPPAAAQLRLIELRVEDIARSRVPKEFRYLRLPAFRTQGLKDFMSANLNFAAPCTQVLQTRHWVIEDLKARGAIQGKSVPEIDRELEADASSFIFNAHEFAAAFSRNQPPRFGSQNVRSLRGMEKMPGAIDAYAARMKMLQEFALSNLEEGCVKDALSLSDPSEGLRSLDREIVRADKELAAAAKHLQRALGREAAARDL